MAHPRMRITAMIYKRFFMFVFFAFITQCTIRVSSEN